MSSYSTMARADLLFWAQAHAPTFTTNAAAIGLSTGQASAFSTATTAAAAALLAMNQAHDASKVATQQCLEAFNALRSSSGDTVRLIRAFAEVQVKPSTVYNLAQIPAPATPTPMPPPGQCSDLRVTLTPGNGKLTLDWKSDNPVGATGTSYIIRRQLPTQTTPQFVGTTGKKKFVDTTFVAGPDMVIYTVQAQRADSTGPESEPFIVRFGQAAGGEMTVSVSTLSAERHDGLNGSAANGSTVNGKAVSKTLPSGNGSRGKSRV